jgi:hypothetical protein
MPHRNSVIDDFLCPDEIGRHSLARSLPDYSRTVPRWRRPVRLPRALHVMKLNVAAKPFAVAELGSAGTMV